MDEPDTLSTDALYIGTYFELTVEQRDKLVRFALSVEDAPTDVLTADALLSFCAKQVGLDAPNVSLEQVILAVSRERP